MVAVVQIIGLSLCAAVRIIICSLDKFGFSLVITLYVSTRTILLFTTIPARAITPKVVNKELENEKTDERTDEPSLGLRLRLAMLNIV